ncbi:MAG: hypothetical protein HC893_03465 [Chloroflexaceae bacterium]|nr:hypothetical protein [Chloroflexaceae bacterium]
MFEWTLSFTDFDGTTVKRGQKFGLEAKAKIGFKGLGLGLSGNYNRETLSTHEVSVQQQFQIKVALASVNSLIGNVTYSVQPYAYWQAEGPLVVDYAVELAQAPRGNPIHGGICVMARYPIQRSSCCGATTPKKALHWTTNGSAT